jgi:hypothetical protein
MEIERLPLGQSHADKCRAGRLRWLNMPPGMPPEMAVEFIAKLKAGSTIRKLTSGDPKHGPSIVTYERFKKHRELHPGWAVEASRISKINGRAGKGARLRNRTHCVHGHSLADAFVSVQGEGWVRRACRTCRTIRMNTAYPIRPEVAKKVELLLRRGVTINSLTSSKSKQYLVQHKTLTRFRLENPAINDLVLNNLKDANRRGQALRYLREKNAVKREENNDYYTLRAMLPQNFPDKDDVLSAIFEDLLTGTLQREDVRARIQTYITAHNRMFPTNFAKFGSGKLVSLDEVMFEDGSTTRGDTVSRGLWD